MSYEEFGEITGLTVSHSYYIEQIEPEYIKSDLDKFKFCENFLEKNKTDICKSLFTDISNLMDDSILLDSLKFEFANLFNLNSTVLETVHKFDNKFRTIISSHLQDFR